MTAALPELPKTPIPGHVAIIMDGNGRWARQRGRPRAFGHRAGVRAARQIVRTSHACGVRTLTLFAFSQENWQRPESEVQLLIQIFVQTLSREVERLHRNGARLKFLGDHAGFPEDLRRLMRDAMERTAGNDRLELCVAVGYGGQWDILQAARRCVAEGRALEAAELERGLETAGLPPVDLLIRTGGEQRLSNFMLWQLAYSELYFTPTLWPDFGEAEFRGALEWYAGRERRFGRVGG